MNATQDENTTDHCGKLMENASEDESIRMSTVRDEEVPVDEALEVTEAGAQGDAPKTVLVDGEIVIVSLHSCVVIDSVYTY